MRIAGFPPPPVGLKGRREELRVLVAALRETRPARLALVGGGGSGKSMLACALGHALARDFGGRIHWFRVGAWDFRTLVEMLALSFGVSRERRRSVPELVALLSKEERLIVLDNHEDDHAVARLLDALAPTKATVVVTARRCLLAGVLIFPVTAPLATTGRPAFARVASLTRMLRHSPLALDIADAIVGSRAARVRSLEAFLLDGGVSRVRVIEHEDDLPEVALLVDWAWRRLDAASKRAMAVLAHTGGDSVDGDSLAVLARVSDGKAAIAKLVRWHLVQTPLVGRYALHAVVRHAVRKFTRFDPAREFEHYAALLERDPSRLRTEQTHLFSAMDYAHRAGDLDAMLRVERLLASLDAT